MHRRRRTSAGSTRRRRHRYTPLQNEEHAEFLNRLADESGAIFDTAGSLRGGRQVFVTMRLPKSLMVGGSDRVELNIAALNSHDGNSAFRLLITSWSAWTVVP